MPCFASSDVFRDSVFPLPIQRQLPARFSFDPPRRFRFSDQRSISFPEYGTTSLGIREIAKDEKRPGRNKLKTNLKMKFILRQLSNKSGKVKKVCEFNYKYYLPTLCPSCLNKKHYIRIFLSTKSSAVKNSCSFQVILFCRSSKNFIPRVWKSSDNGFFDNESRQRLRFCVNASFESNLSPSKLMVLKTWPSRSHKMSAFGPESRTRS